MLETDAICLLQILFFLYFPSWSMATPLASQTGNTGVFLTSPHYSFIYPEDTAGTKTDGTCVLVGMTNRNTSVCILMSVSK